MFRMRLTLALLPLFVAWMSTSAVGAKIFGIDALTEFTWNGAIGSQDWQQNGNWDMSGWPNDTDPNTGSLHAANVAVGLGGNLNLNVGATDVRIAGISLGGTAGAVTTEISSSNGKLVFRNGDIPILDPNNDADFNNDGVVSGTDFSIWQRGFGKINQTTGNNGDANFDTVVDNLDLNIWYAQYGFGSGRFNEGQAYINSIGTAGSTNIISSPFHSDNEPIQIGGTNDLTFTSSANFTYNGNLATSASNASISVISNPITVTMNGGITVDNTDPNGGIDFRINNSIRSSGTLVINGVISDADPNDPAAIDIGVMSNNIRHPLGTVVLNAANTFRGSIRAGRGNLVLGNDDALGAEYTDDHGTMDPNDDTLERASYRQAGPANQYGYNLISDNPNRVMHNDILLAQWQTFKGSNSLTLTGEITQTNNRGMINNIESSGTLNVDGRISIWGDSDFVSIDREFEIHGSGTTKITGEIRDVSVDVEEDPNAPEVSGEVFRLTKNGTGSLIIDVDAGKNTHQGRTTIVMGNLHYADNDSLNTGGGNILAYGGAVGVDSHPGGQNLGTNTAFLGLIDSNSTGGLMLASSDANVDLNFNSGSLVNAANMTVAAPETGLTYTGKITPANSTYGLGGGTGTLTLPDPNQLTGANNVEIRNGGTVEVLGDNNYTGTTQIRSRYASTNQEQAEADSSNDNDAESLFLDRLVSPTLVVDHLDDGGQASSIGAATSDAENLLIHAATLKYVGTGDTTDRLFTIGTGGATIDSSGTGALVFENAGTLGRRDLLEATGTLNDTTGNPNEIVNLKNKAGGGDIRDFVAGMTVNDPDPGDLFGTSGKCGGPTGLEWGGFGSNDGSNCIPLYEDPNERVPGEGGFDFSLVNTDPNAYRPIDVEATGMDDSGTVIGIDRIFPLIEKFNTTIVFGAVPRTLTLTGDNAGDNEIASIISDSDHGSVVSILKQGSGKWILSGANTNTGDTTVEEGILSITDAFLDPNSAVYVDVGGVLDLDFTGTNVIDDLFFGIGDDAKQQKNGLWGAIGNGLATFTSAFFTGDGLLNVGGVPLTGALAAVPEPSVLLLAAMACMGLTGYRRRGSRP